MRISELREMCERERIIWFKNAKRADYKELLMAENLAGGISKFKSADLLQVTLDLMEGIVTELTQQLKPNPKQREKKEGSDKPKKTRAKKQKNIIEEVEYDNTCWFEEERIDTTDFDELLNYNMNTVTADVVEVIKEKAQEEIWYDEMTEFGKNFKCVIDNEEMSMDFNEEPTYYIYFSIDSYSRSIDDYNKNYKEIKSKYRRMAKYFHPDNLETGDRNKFEEIQSSWEVAEEVNKIWYKSLQEKGR